MPTSKSLTAKMLFDLSLLAGRMVANGLTAPAATEKAELFSKCAETLQKQGLADDAEVHCFFVPGRIEVLGKHTDYAGGRSVVAAVDKGFCIVAAAGNNAVVRIFNAAANEQVEFPVSSEIDPRIGHWSNYAVTVVRRLAKNFAGIENGCDIAFASDLPPASGMSSSTAMVIGFYLCLSACNNLTSHEQYRQNIKNTEDLAMYLACTENGQSFGALAGDKGVGTFGGSEDHIAILCSKAGSLSRYSYCPVRFEQSIELPGEYIFAVASSGVVAEKTGAAMAKYNRISGLCRRVLELCNQATGRNDPNLAAVVTGVVSAGQRLPEIIKQANDNEFGTEELIARFKHFFIESEQIVPAASDALAAGDMEEFGKQVDLSHKFAEQLLGNQVPETIFLAKSARDLGAAAASAFGAGFGGSVWALTKIKNSNDFLAKWSDLYKAKFPERAGGSRFLLSGSGPAAFEL